jgi:hypothetical protein
MLCPEPAMMVLSPCMPAKSLSWPDPPYNVSLPSPPRTESWPLPTEIQLSLSLWPRALMWSLPLPAVM